MINHFYYPSSDGITKIHAVEWTCDVAPRAVLQIAHGMVEYVMRYDKFAQYLSSKGIVVVGNDHLGHGESVISQHKLGFFATTDGNKNVLEDMRQLKVATSSKYKNIPYFLMGHSMGSFLTRQFIQKFPEGLSGAIIMGTGHQPNALLNSAMALSKTIAAFKGWEYRSKFVDNLAFGAYNKTFEPARTPKEWLSSDNSEVDKYIADPLCSVLFTLNGYYNLFYSIKDASKKKNVAKIPKNLPIYFVAGQRDPVGSFGKGVIKVKDSFVKAGLKNVNLTLYKEGRHEILNDFMRKDVCKDILLWINKILEVNVNG